MAPSLSSEHIITAPKNVPIVITDTICIVCIAGSMKQYGVCPSICPIHPLQQRVAGLLLWASTTAVGCDGRMQEVPRCQRT